MAEEEVKDMDLPLEMKGIAEEMALMYEFATNEEKEVMITVHSTNYNVMNYFNEDGSPGGRTDIMYRFSD